MGNLKYIDEIGAGTDQDTETEAVLEDDTIVDSEEDSGDFVQDSSESQEEQAVEEDETDSEDSRFSELQKQIEGMEKRIADKDAYIQELRDASKQKEAQSEPAQVDTKEEEEDFWDNPEGTIKKLQDTIKIQQLQIQETVYANTVEGYWNTVNPEALKKAVATDAEFATEFNNSREPYRTAYEYLKRKTEETSKSEQSLREKIKAEILAEMGVKKEKRETPPNINGGSKPKSSPNSGKAVDGFSSVFGSDY